MRRMLKSGFLVCGMLAGLASIVYADLTPGPFAIRLPSVNERGGLDYTRMRQASMYLSYSAKYPGKIVGRAVGNVTNSSGERQDYERANVASTIFSLETTFFRSSYTVFRNGAADLWALGNPK